MNCSQYALISSARDEGLHIGKMLESVLRQSQKPVRHVVVDDGSVDDTAKIVQEYQRRESFVELIQRKHDGQRNVGSKVSALAAAYDRIKHLQFEYVGCLDADITLPENYYEAMIERMNAYPQLGIASGIYLEKRGGRWKRVMSNARSVPGALQFFRRECFDAIGGYQSVKVVGEDSLAEMKARMKGWHTRSYDDIFAHHHKPRGSAIGGGTKTCYRCGMSDYLLGRHPLYVMLKGVRRLAERPYVFGAVAHLLGYWWLAIRRERPDVPDDLRDYIKREDIKILRLAIFHLRRPY